jgi:hypothetical protein
MLHIFEYQESLVGYILEGLEMENVCKCCDHLCYFKAIWYMLRQFCIFYGHLVYTYFPFWNVVPKNLASLVVISK